MVGVPRSKGCHNCRRRKVACDQAKPMCQNCRKRGVSCEGYAKYPTFLQYTAERGGRLKKRERLEEAKFVDDFDLIVPMRSSSVTSCLQNQPPVSRFLQVQLQVKCVDSYLPGVGKAMAVEELKTSWMWMVLDLPNQGHVLELALAALCAARVGLQYGDANLLAKARVHYAKALNVLQHALQSPELAFQDRTLAAIRTLSIYELVSIPWTVMSQAYVHEEGMTQWCLAAGPQGIDTEFALQVFHDVRWCIMYRAIDGRKRSALGTKEWQTLPWRLFAKDSLQELFDVGFELAALLERLDLCESPQLPEASVSKRARLGLSCSVTHTTLDEWYARHWSSRDVGPVSSPGTTSNRDFSSFWEATNVAYYWVFKMILNDIQASTAAQEMQEDLAFSSLEFAVNIVSTASHFLSDGTGWLGPQRLFFPLQRAMALLLSKQSPFVEDAQKVFGQLLRRLRSHEMHSVG